MCKQNPNYRETFPFPPMELQPYPPCHPYLNNSITLNETGSTVMSLQNMYRSSLHGL